jgi:hypothetical protein
MEGMDAGQGAHVTKTSRGTSLHDRVLEIRTPLYKERVIEAHLYIDARIRPQMSAARVERVEREGNKWKVSFYVPYGTSIGALKAELATRDCTEQMKASKLSSVYDIAKPYYPIDTEYITEFFAEFDVVLCDYWVTPDCFVYSERVAEPNFAAGRERKSSELEASTLSVDTKTTSASEEVEQAYGTAKRNNKGKSLEERAAEMQEKAEERAAKQRAEAERRASKRAAEQAAATDGRFAVTLMTLSGDERLVKGLRPDDRLSALVEKAARVLAVPMHELKLCSGSLVFNVKRLHDPLHELGIRAGCTLTAVRQARDEKYGPAEYRIMQGVLFKKPSKDPASEKVIQLNRPVGSKIKTTGETWKGPSGGEWVYLDPFVEKEGWVLIKGTGSLADGRRGPLLEKVVPGEEEPILLTVFSPDKNELCKACVRQSQTLAALKVEIGRQCPDLNIQYVQLLSMEARGTKMHGFKRYQDFNENELLVKTLALEDGDKLPINIVRNWERPESATACKF